jgi:transcriptional regulator with XRE-family HTH domain
MNGPSCVRKLNAHFTLGSSPDCFLPRNRYRSGTNLIGQGLRRIRQRKELSQQVLADRCKALGWDVTALALGRIEKRQQRLTDIQLFCLATALQVSVDDFYGNGRLLTRSSISNRKKPAL